MKIKTKQETVRKERILERKEERKIKAGRKKEKNRERRKSKSRKIHTGGEMRV